MFKIQKIKIPKDKYIISTYVFSGEKSSLIKEEEFWTYETEYISSGEWDAQNDRLLTDEEQARTWDMFLSGEDISERIFFEEIPVDKEIQDKINEINKIWHETIL